MFNELISHLPFNLFGGGALKCLAKLEHITLSNFIYKK